MTAVYAAPCSQEIERVQARIDAKLEAAARIGALAPESSAALLHRQPTPGSIAAAENRLGEVSSATVAAVAAAMARAREAKAPAMRPLASRRSQTCNAPSAPNLEY
jgi:hypothetical protein